MYVDNDAEGRLGFDVAIRGPELVSTPTVLALHGFPQGARSFEKVTEDLVAAGLRVVAPDQRGYSPNATPIGREHYTNDALAGDVIGLLDALGIDKVHLVGHDWGSHVAWVTAAMFPERVHSLTAVSVPHPEAYARSFRESETQRKSAEYIKLFWQEGKAEHVLLAEDARRLRAMLGDVDPNLVDYYVARMQQPGALTGALSWYRAMGLSPSPVPNVTVPTTFVWSDQDIAISRDAAVLCERYVDGEFEFLVIEGVSHWIPERAPEALSAAILTRVAGSAR